MRVPAQARPAELVGAVEFSLARDAAAESRWSAAIDHAAKAVHALPRDSQYQQKLGLLRSRQPLMDDHKWETMSASIDPAVRLRSDDLAPEVSQVWACGAYHARGRGRAAPWSRYLRASKDPPSDPTERAAVFRLACGYMCRFIAERTDVLAVADVVVPIPADPDRYVRRMASLPDELAKAVEAQLAIPAELFALQNAGTGVEMKLLARAERHAAAEEAFRSGPRRAVFGRGVLLVDDLITTGSTLRSAAALLLDAGATTVVAAALNHTEG